MHTETIRAINRDIKLAIKVFGAARVSWPPQPGWIRINKYGFPKGYNQRTTNLLIIIPPHYGVTNVPLREFYMSKGLLIKNRRSWQTIPHYYGKGIHNKYSRQGWAFYCINPRSWTTTDNILTFIKLIDLTLQNPFK